ncbi:carboxy-S-adenosyl-L-methionine synthase CmoA [Crenothrix sp.]|uniref:carboxy-S-adenosyl-L-methionine synthase CmoA n=1 Tax=Crenothrix sp. TaxID=3100433 RepID=UPI00374C93E5
MTDHDKLFQQTSRTEDFAFDERVANVFDDMVSRSVPFYNELQRIQSDLIIGFLPQNAAIVCDFGCSTGTTLEHIAQHPKCPTDIELIGYDNSDAMLDKARIKLADLIAAKKVSLRLADLGHLQDLPKFNVAILNWTLQFVRPIEREQVLKTIFNALHPGGIVLLSEKILSNDSVLNRLYIEHYLQFKIEQGGYSDAENQKKREALENVLIPYRLDENYALLERAGFARIDTYFKWFNFASMIAVKI